MSKLKTKKKIKKSKTAAKKIISKKNLKTKKTVKAKVKTTVKAKPKNPVKAKVKKAAAKKITRSIKPIRSKKAVDAKDLFSAKELRDITKQLKELRISLANIVKTKKELDLVEHDTGDVIDIASQSLDKEMFFELSGNEIAMLEDVDAALRRIDNGVFGLCEYCRKPIRKLRIKAIPQARYCLACQSGNEQNPRT
ncbi:MAG: TraR/DksA family transcriptional regulator [Elusimicrobiales bacterium]|nr:TraR/DksA family transcriptional regulator [Elusimicrobiales bacterium]MCK5358058.1 TraR/DksA family transcriptional regulator [Elusimicrobiales bacterium]